MWSFRKRFRSGAIPFLLLALVGCGPSGPQVVKVNGILTYKGKPVTNATINFLPEHGRQSWAQTDEQGRFKVNYDRHQDGAVVGKHKVWFDLRATTAAEQQAVMMGRTPKMSQDTAEFFKKYNQENSKVEVQIDKNMGEFKLELN